MKVDLWAADLNQIPDQDFQILAPLEQKLTDQFKFEKHRTRFIKRRVMLRKILGHYLDKSPRSVGIGYTKLGKPFLAMSAEKLYFNISHSKDQVLIGVSRDAHLGVDIEFLDPEIESELISTHFFAPTEISLIRNSEGIKKSEAFFRLWTIKEAFIKLIGKGLSYPLEDALVKDTMDKPKIRIPDGKDYTCEFISNIPNYAIGVVVSGKALELNLRNMAEVL
ncbi:4'-phosphopantetheinyl transferase family protein [Algoriphagus sediminis]|uniref:4'-phosphopantetheinyl transferase superfamily protein n=1 Tax=Algoriphagus sediminis TaxID=3057113 RepID=A0ABT7YD61_9BACT|nr:4'-phosphopantetheinyl transferase superfamily protein [Algoriphagus sediminis]MDN3204401.1 4'-phosphopantetheinyl transferase superfamily protein [Algoriphagus sediminis]